jgi:hypothetical protein
MIRAARHRRGQRKNKLTMHPLMVHQAQADGGLRRLPPQLLLVSGDDEFLITSEELDRVGQQCLDLKCWADEDTPR